MNMTNTLERPYTATELPDDAKLTLTLELTPDLAIRLTNVAAHHDVSVREYALGLLVQAASEEVPVAPSLRPSRLASGEVAARGKEWYERDIRHKVNTPENKGKALVINVDTGEYEMDDNGDAALTRARAKHPESLFLRMRVGYKAYGKMGGSWRNMEE